MKLRLEVSLREGFNNSVFLKRMSEFGAEVDFDTKQGSLEVSKFQISDIDEVIAYLRSTFIVRRMELIPSGNNEIPSSKETKAVEAEESLNQQQTELPKAEFSHKLIEERMNKFLQVAGMAINKNNAEAKAIASFLSTAICELAMMYHPRPLVDIKVGDIVTCNYGYHMPGEVSGRYVHSIVCSFDETTVYVLPITKDSWNDGGVKYLQFYSVYDATYTDPFCKDYAGGSVLLQQGRRVRRERISGVVGYIHSHFLSELLHILPATLCFADELAEIEVEEPLLEDDIDISNLEIPDLPSLDEDFDEPIEVEKTETEVEVVVPRSMKNNAFETAVYKKFAKGLSELGEEKPLEDNIRIFCDALGLPNNSVQLEAAFKATMTQCRIMRITNSSIVNSIFPIGFLMTKPAIGNYLNTTFKKWLDANPELKENAPKNGFSFSALFRFFYKLVKQN